MKICLITLSTPSFNNVRAASALPYHLILGAKENVNVDFEIYSFNINNLCREEILRTEHELHVSVHIVKKPTWMNWMLKLHLTFMRILLKRPLMAHLKLPKDVNKKINTREIDKVWIYGEEIAGLSKHFKEKKCIVTMPDCESLYYYRLLELPWINRDIGKVLRYSYAYWQYKRMERKDCQFGVKYHFVGKADAEFYQRSNPQSNAIFLPHPLYAFKFKDIGFHKPKIKLLFAGRYDFYCQHGSDEVLDKIIVYAQDLINTFEITFLGKGWESWLKRLVEAGFTSHHIVYAPNYIEELHKHDIQVNAIDVGTGTKGKVLDALANGLLVIGSKYALENIKCHPIDLRNVEQDVKNFGCRTQVLDSKTQCEPPILSKIEAGAVCFHSSNEFVKFLLDIPNDKQYYEKMAKKGYEKILTIHNRKIIANNLFGLFN